MQTMMGVYFHLISVNILFILTLLVRWDGGGSITIFKLLLVFPQFFKSGLLLDMCKLSFNFVVILRIKLSTFKIKS